MRRTIFLGVVCLLAPFSAGAFNIGDTTVIIPIIGRFSGVPPSQWRTDVFIANHSTVAKTLTLNFYVSGGSKLTAGVPVGTFSTVTLRDIVLNTFGQTVAAGQLEIVSPNQSGFEARARIYNAGSTIGEFGQSVPGVGTNYLSRQAFMYGLSGINGNRVNVGLANPNTFVVTGTLRFSDKNGVDLASTSVTLQPHETRQYNDVFTAFGFAPQADVQVEFNAVEFGIYGYASEVRNDSGDAIFVFGTSPNS
jgi:hypothetical protein